MSLMRPDGYMEIVGRSKDMIIRGGENGEATRPVAGQGGGGGGRERDSPILASS